MRDVDDGGAVKQRVHEREADELCLVLFVVSTADRAVWLRRAAGGVRDGSAWVTTLDELRGRGLGARLAPVPGPSAMPMVLGDLGAGPSPLAGPAVGSQRWLELLGSGAAEAAG